MPIERPGDLDPLTVPAVMPQSVRRMNETGFPTQALLDYEQALQAWMKNNTIKSNERLSKIYEEYDDEFVSTYAAITEERIARADADGALAQRTLTIEAEMQGARQGSPSLSARIQQVDTARVTGDSALAQRSTDIEAEIRNARGGEGTLSAKINSVDQARIDADIVIAGRVDTLSTRVNDETARLTLVKESVDGVKVKYGVEGYVGGQYGGFVFTGVKRLDGVGANFLLQIDSNVVINGAVTINGTLTTEKAAGSAFTQAVGVRSGAVSASVGIVTRAGASVQLVASFDGASGAYFGLGFNVGQLIVYRDGIAIVAVGTAYEGSGSGSSAGIALQATATCAVDAPPAGYHDYTVYNSNAVGIGGVALVVVESAR